MALRQVLERRHQRCHESVSDPIPDADYHELASVLIANPFSRLASSTPPKLLDWLHYHHPDLAAEIEAAEEAVNEAAAHLDPASPDPLAPVREAVAEMEAAWMRGRDAWPVERVRVYSSLGVVELVPREGVPVEELEAFAEWVKREMGEDAGEIRWCEDKKETALAEPGRKDSLPPAEGELFPEDKPGPENVAFRSPWDEWLEGAEVSLVSGLPAWREALDVVRVVGVCGVDVETTGLDPLVNRIRLVQLAVPVGAKQMWADGWKGPREGAGVRVYVLDTFSLPNEDRLLALSMLADLVADENVQKVGHNMKFDLAMLRANLGGRRLKMKNLFDTMLASQLVWAGDFIPERDFARVCEKLGLQFWTEKQRAEYRRAREESGVGAGQEPTQDTHGHWVFWERGHERYYPVHSLQQVTHRHLEVWLDKELQASDWVGELTEEQIHYAARDAVVLLPLAEILSALIKRNGLTHVAALEMGCLPAVVEIELSGMPFDAPHARELKEEAQHKLDEAVSTLEALAAGVGLKGKKGTPWNWASPYDSLDALKRLAEEAGVLGPSGGFMLDGEEMKAGTNDDLLSRVAARVQGTRFAEFVAALKEARGRKKEVDFYDKWLSLLHPADDRLHPSLRQLNPNGAGRFSAREPNIQQTPRGSDIRTLFKAPEGRKLVICDWSGIEMRIMAQLSRDETLCRVFKEGIDIHKFTAAQVSGKSLDEVTKEERQAAKPLNFGIIYGMRGKTLQSYAETNYNVHMTLEEAERAREAFFRTYTGVAAWHERQRQRMFRDNFETVWRHRAEAGLYSIRRPTARTLAGRMRVWPVEEATSRAGKAYKRKVGPVTELYNSPDQGSGADMLKLAMEMLYDALLERGWEDVWLIMCVHDELILEAPIELAEEAEKLIKEVMLEAARRVLPDVVVEAESHVADSWAEK